MCTTHIAQASWVQTSLQKQDPNPSQNLTKLHFYFHDITGGSDRSVALIAKPENSTSYGFGSLIMIDDPLTVGPDKRSKLIGRAQGMYGIAVIASQTEPILLITLTYSFLEERYNGSSISVLGRYDVAAKQREMPILGGSGVFRLARGYVIAKPYKFGKTKNEDIVEYEVFVFHSDTSFMH